MNDIQPPVLPPGHAPRGTVRAVGEPPRRVLVVDDNVDAADTLAALLRLRGHEVQAVYDGHAALDAARASRPDIVFLDLVMPGMDGYAVAHKLRDEGFATSAVLIALTGFGTEEDRERIHAAGFDEYVRKPVAESDLHDVMTLQPRSGVAAS